ncbi:olfactory receptor 10A3-like [Erpetoichthys calabaricus]|uniref:olfactory receptor 10A3-like n=1 Tax=Erpetoichthys calabaricus TaxID=27687 RepID=UPI00223459D7|nr:olfactory receptor 10A3-like [Erpetoichthys calabaricus]
MSELFELYMSERETSWRMNQSNLMVQEFIVVGFPGIQDRSNKNILFGVLLVVYLCIILGNLLITIAFLTDHTMHTPMYTLIFSLALLDMMSSTTTVPKFLDVLGSDSGVISITACFIQMFLYGILKTTEAFLLGLMAYDRYLAICKPLHYFIITNNNLILKLIIGCWAIAFILVVPRMTVTVRLPFCGKNKLVHFFCDHSSVIYLACGSNIIGNYAGISAGVSIVLGPLLFIVYSYVRILMSVFKIESSHGRLKALSTCSSHLMVICVSYLVGGSAYIASSFSRSSADVDIMGALIQNVMPPLINPIIYCLKTKEMQARIVKLIKMKNTFN